MNNTPDFEQARHFLESLDPDNQEFTFQTFDDDADRKSRSHARVLHGSLAQHWDELCRLNDQGAGVFVTINATDGQGRSASNVTRIRGVFADFDSPEAASVRLAGLKGAIGIEPTLFVESSIDKHHAYWLADDVSLSEFGNVQRALSELLGSDPSVKDLSRVMRLPGFVHRKIEPFITRIIHEGSRSNMADIHDSLAPLMDAPEKPRQSSPVSTIGDLSPYAEAALDGALRAIFNAPDGARNDTLNREAFGIFGLVKAGEIPEHDARIPLERAARGAGLADGEISATLGSAWDSATPREIPERSTSPAASSGLEVSSAAQRLADSITRRVCEHCGVNEQNEPDLAETLKADAAVIDAMIKGSFWSGSKSKLFVLNHSQNLNQYVGADAFKFLRMTFGPVLDRDAVKSVVRQKIDFGEVKDLEGAVEKYTSKVMGLAGTAIMDHLKFHNQRDSIEWRVDMFTARPYMDLREDKARIVLQHKPFSGPTGYDQRVIEDYREHFPRFDELLEFLVMSRFAKDRKKSYLWILADSDWGKGFLVDGVLKEMQATVSTSVREIEAMFEGKPVGRSPEDFKRAFALVVDEFKTVKSELKQLQSEISLSPKNQLTSSVEVFAKVFLSAESVASLVTENGVEDQFANRMSIFVEKGSLPERALFKEVGNPAYFQSVLAYTIETMNRRISEMQALGRLESQTQAERWLSGFIGRNGLDTMFERFSDALPSVAGDIVQWVTGPESGMHAHTITDTASGRIFLPSPAKRVDDYLEQHFDRSEIGAYRKRKAEIMKHMSEDGQGARAHRLNGQSKKCIWLKSA